MDPFDSLTFDTADGAMSLVLAAIDFDSEGAATDHVSMTVAEGSGMPDLPDRIGDVAANREAFEAGIGSVIVFKKREWAVILRTTGRRSTQRHGVSPVADLA